MKNYRYDKPNNRRVSRFWVIVAILAGAILAFSVALSKYWVKLS